MYLLHYIIPFIIFYFYRDKIMLWGLLLGNFIDLDHIYYRIIGKVPWFGSACQHFGMQCSLNFYPLHNTIVLAIALPFISLLSFEDKRLRIIGWIAAGVALHFFLDYLHLLIGFGI